MENQEVFLENVLTEEELLEFLGLERRTLDGLRYSGQLPFCRITKKVRLYLVSDVVEFIKSKRMATDADDQVL